MDISQKIDSIIAERKKILPQLETVMDRVEKAKQQVDRLEAFRTTQCDEMPPELMAKLASISTDKFYHEYQSSMERLNNLHQRFSRDRINISFVGRAGHGKSLVLQRISGLEGDVVPSADGSDCTGARSVISNHPGGETRAEITFFTEKELVDIVNVYLREIFKSGSYTVTSARDISALNMKEIRDKISIGQVMEKTLLEHLQKYVEHIHEFQDKFGKHITIPKEKIESYVAQYSSKDHSVKYYNYLGVKSANILASFPYSQCGKIVLVDTIGTGATSLGVEEEMLQIVRNDSDAIILMMRPEPIRPRPSSEDYHLIHKVTEAVSPEYARQMLFYLINCVATGKATNIHCIPEFKNNIRNFEYPIAKILYVDIWDQKEVEEKLLIPVLEQMSSKLAGIDQLIIDNANQQLAALEQAYLSISACVDRALGASINQDERRAFHPRITEVIAKVTNEIRKLYIKHDEEKGAPCTVLEEAGAEKLKNILRGLPSKETILERLNDGTIIQFDALQQLTNQLRLQIINDFLGLNMVLHDIVLKMKREVAGILSGEAGGLGKVIGASLDDPEIWLQGLKNSLDETQFPLLRDALQPLEDFHLRMENFLIYKVRCCLKSIDWSANIQPPQLVNGPGNQEALAEEIDSVLRHQLEIVHQNIANELSDFYSFPNTAIYAVLRDFYDRIAFARTQDGQTVELEWQYLYEDKIPFIWPEEHSRYIAAAGRAEEWRALTETIHAYAKEGYFLIGTAKEIM